MHKEIIRFLRPRLALLLAVMMLFSVLPVHTGAEETSTGPSTRWEDQVSGTFTETSSDLISYTHYAMVDDVLTSETVTIDPAATLGSKENPIAISSEEDLILFGQQISLQSNPTSDKYYILTKQTYDMGGHSMMPLAAAAVWSSGNSNTFSSDFRGVLIGNGAVIKDAYVVGGVADKGTYGTIKLRAGLFSGIGSNGKIWDLTVENCTVSGGSGDMGVLCAVQNGSQLGNLVNVNISGTMIPNENTDGFALLGTNTTNCTADVTLAGDVEIYSKTLYSGEKLTIDTGCTLTVRKDQVLTINEGAQLINNGTLAVLGTVNGTVSGNPIHVHSVVDGACEDCGLVCGTDFSHHFSSSVCTQCGKTCGVDMEHQWDNYGRCERCYKNCSHESFTERVCDECGIECGGSINHSFGLDDKCIRCGFMCGVDAPHEWNEWGYCWVCYLDCEHASFTGNICDTCGTTCGGSSLAHNIGDNYTCTNCGFICGETAEHSYQGASCSVCGFVCTHETVANGACQQCGLSMGLYIVMIDSYGDGWNGNGIAIIVNGTQVGTATFSSGETGTYNLADDENSSYGFRWIAGGYSSECSFKIYLQGVEVYSATGTDCNNFGNNELFHTICSHDSYTINTCNGCGRVCGSDVVHQFDENHTCALCGMTCGVTLPHSFDSTNTCTVCGLYCAHETFNGVTCANCGLVCGTHVPHSFDSEHLCSLCGFQCGVTEAHDWDHGICTVCGMICNHNTFDDIACTTCGAYDPAELNSDGYYEIKTLSNLFWFSDVVKSKHENYYDANAVLMADLDVGDHTWIPIGSSSAYSGIFDGAGHTVSGLKITDVMYGGFIGNLDNGGVKNLTVSGDIDVLKRSYNNINYTGLLVGYMTHSALYNCKAVGTVKVFDESEDTAYIGGMVGYANHTVIINCSADVDVVLESSINCNGTAYVGGLGGYVAVGSETAQCILNSYATGDITVGTESVPYQGTTYVGGIAGYLRDDAVNNYYYGNLSVNCAYASHVGYAFGHVFGYAFAMEANSPSIDLIISHNYYPEGQTAVGSAQNEVQESWTVGVSEEDILADSGDNALYNILNSNLPYINQIITEHLGFLTESEWQEIVENIGGEEFGACHWKSTGASPAFCATQLADECVCEDCGSELHDYTDATCTAPKVCTKCQQPAGNPLDHTDDDNSGRCDDCNCLIQSAKLCFASISLKGNIAINYYMLLSDEVLADESAYMQFTMADGEVIQIPVAQGIETVYNGDTYHVFTCAVAAKEMTDEVKSQFFYADGSTSEHSYTVKTYADYILENSNNVNLKALVVAMLNYGAASQTHFGYNTDRLANAGLEVPDFSAVTIESFGSAAGQGTDLATFYSASLILKSETSLRFFFQVDSSVESFGVTHNGQTLEIKQRGSLYYVDVVGISAKDLEENVTITINDGISTADVAYNPMAYCFTIVSDTTGTFDQETKNVAAALYLYNQAANTYFAE